MIHVVIPHRLGEPFIYECMRSIASQNLTDVEVHWAPDKKQKGALYNIVQTCQGLDGVVVQLDGDDYLLPGAIDAIRQAFDDPNCWVAWGITQRSDHQPWFAGRYESDDFRGQPFRAVGVRCFRSELFEKIDPSDFMIGGWWQNSSWDLALMLPMLEMAGLERIRFIEKPISVYRIHEGNDAAQSKIYQDFCHWYSQQRPKYSNLSWISDAPTRTPHTLKKGLLLVPGIDGGHDISCRIDGNRVIVGEPWP